MQYAQILRGAVVISLMLLIVAAIGANPRYLEELRIGGGYNEPADGGADFLKDGRIFTNGAIEAGGGFVAGDDSAAGMVAYHTQDDAMELGTRDGAQTVHPALRIQQGAADVQVLGHQHVAGQVTEGVDYQGLSTTGLLALWRFEAEDTLTDWSGNGFAATVTGTGVTAVPGKYGAGLSLSGADYATASTAIASEYGGADLSITAWIKTSSEAGAMSIAGWFGGSSQEQFMLRLINGMPSAILRNTDAMDTVNVTGSEAVNTGQWHHLAAVREYGATLSLYVDGRLAVSAVDGAGDVGATVQFMLGALNLTPINPFSGVMDEISLWARALSASEVWALSQQRLELAPGHGHGLLEGDLRASGNGFIEGGGLEAGQTSAVRGVVTLWEGSGGDAPGALRLVSSNGTSWYIFAENNGRLRIHNALPEDNTAGEVVGLQN